MCGARAGGGGEGPCSDLIDEAELLAPKIIIFQGMNQDFQGRIFIFNGRIFIYT